MNKHRVRFSLAVIQTACFLVAQPCLSETLRVTEQHALDNYYGVTQALRPGRDSVLFLSTDGLYLQGSSEQGWKRLIDCTSEFEQVPFSVCQNDRLTRLIYPEGMWRHAATGGYEILIYEGFCNRLYRLRESNDSTFFLTKCDQRKGDDQFGVTSVQDGTILSTLWGNDTKEKIVIQRIDGGHYRRRFRCSENLVRWRDSVDLDHSSLGIPAINPVDSALWLAIDGYPYVYVIDLDGELRDSVPITNPDYKQPQPIRSRMKSDAVVDEWFAQWTPIWFFSYVPPGYFIMQYKIGTDTCAGRQQNKFATIVWNTNKRIIPLSVDPHWHIAGVQDDGRIIFVAPEADSSGCKETIIVTRIEP